MTECSHEKTIFVASGAAIGAGVSSTIGSVGLIGSFGGIGIGVTPMTATGAFLGAAAYGACDILPSPSYAMEWASYQHQPMLRLLGKLYLGDVPPQDF